MKSLGRRLFNLAAAASFFICIAIVALWSVSSPHPIRIRYHRSPAPELFALVHPGIAWELVSLEGLVTFKYNDERDTRFGRYPAILEWVNAENVYSSRDALPLFRRQFAPFTMLGSYNHPELQLAYGRWIVMAIPHWFVVAAAAVVPLAWTIQYLRQRHRITSDSCKQCGYDLRATPKQCPECGTIPNVAEVRRA